MDVDFTLYDRRVQFKLVLDEGSAVDHNMRFMINLTSGTCEPETVHVMARALRPGDIAFDIGANVGFFSLLMERLVSPGGKVVAFEPGGNNLHKLDANLWANKSGVVVCKHPLWSAPSNVKLWMGLDGGENTLAKNGASLGSVDLQATTLAQVMQGQRPRLIKLDAEGSEYHILLGAEDALRAEDTPFILCEMNPKTLSAVGGSIEEMRDLMWEKGYATFVITRDGALPAFVPRSVVIRSARENSMALFSTLEAVAGIWPEAVLP